ncbi:MAG: glycosyltransferase family 4 protein [Desulfosarcina sp.]|nr:glycosyltransferase family 4 protein [Desulfosarcina sp.]MBC2764908.1 glycosyltransferase family 4 protein [Desulfosarcina sp.]
MRILFLTQWFHPEPFFKGLPFAKLLQEQGHKVEVLTGFPNYPGGKLYPGYKVVPFKREVIDGITVNRVPLYPSHDRSGLRRIANYLSFAVSSLLVGPWAIQKPDVVYVYNLITLVWAATLIRTIYKCKIVYDVQDLWPESVLSSGLLNNRIALNLLNKWCNWAYSRADKVAVLSPGFKKELIRRGLLKENIEIIYNWCDASAIQLKINPEYSEKWGLKDTFNVVFAGTMGVMQGMDTVLESACLCQSVLPNVRFVLVGGGVEVKRLQAKAKLLDLKNVVFIPLQPMAEMGKIFGVAHALLVHLKDDPLFKITIPSKTSNVLCD